MDRSNTFIANDQFIIVIVKMTEQSCDNIPDSIEIPDLEEVPHIIERRDLETLIIASIETLKRNNKKCSKEEVLHLVQESVDSEVTKGHFEELLGKLIKCHSVQIKPVGTRTCLSLLKEAQHSKRHKQFNESLRINVNEELSKFKDSVIEKFDALKSSFLAEVHSFKKRHLISCGNDVLAENVSERLIKQLQEDITFLREQLKNEDKVIHSLIQQLAKRDNVLVECNNVNSHETLDKTHCSLLSNHIEVQQNTTHDKLNFIKHVGTNDLNSEVSSKSIAESIVDLAMSLK